MKIHSPIMNLKIQSGWAFLLVIMLVACNQQAQILSPTLTQLEKSSSNDVVSTTWITPIPSVTPSLIGSMTTSINPTTTLTPVFESTPIPLPTHLATASGLVEKWVWNPPGKAVAPILLYHHVSDSIVNSLYSVTPQVFRQQLKILKTNGYTAIPISTLVMALTEGADLPPRPVVITFDDGNLDVYQNAYPIMQEFGFVGTMYIVVNRVGVKGYLGVSEIKKMLQAGWEFGSHSMTHLDLRYQYSTLETEIKKSRLELQELIGAPVMTFAYPFGFTNESIRKKVAAYGYSAGMGLGGLPNHTVENRYYLNRFPVDNNVSLSRFVAVLPWLNSDFLVEKSGKSTQPVH